MDHLKAAELVTRDVVWARPAGLELHATVYDVAGRSAPAPVVVDVHGGAWSTGDRFSGAEYDAQLACAGIVVVAIDFRMGPAFKHPTASADVVAAVRWVRVHADELHVDADSVGLIGSSSGGHLAMLAGLKPNADSHRGTSIVCTNGGAEPRDDVDGSVAYVIGLWPVSDPAARFRYASRAGITRLQDATQSYFVDTNAQWDAAIPRIVLAGEAEGLPPLLIVQPGHDSNIPQDMTFDLLRAYQARGGSIEYAFYPDLPHGFGLAPSAATDDLVRVMRDYIRRRTDN